MCILHYIAHGHRVRILEQSMGARTRVGIGLLYQPARLHRLAKSIPGLLKSLKMPYLKMPIFYI
jgi:hypothetical protein